MDITLSLPDEVLAKAGALAHRSGRKIEEVLSDTLSLSISSIGSETCDSTPWKQRNDEEVLRLCELELPPDDDRQLSELLAKQGEGNLNASERTRLAVLMSRYHDGLLLKAEAMREAVERGLRPPLSL